MIWRLPLKWHVSLFLVTLFSQCIDIVVLFYYNKGIYTNDILERCVISTGGPDLPTRFPNLYLHIKYPYFWTCSSSHVDNQVSPKTSIYPTCTLNHQCWWCKSLENVARTITKLLVRSARVLTLIVWVA